MNRQRAAPRTWQHPRTAGYMVATRRGKKTKGLASANLLTLVYPGAGEKSRTPDLRITNALLYQLSYTGVASRQNQDSSRSRPAT